MCPVPRSANAVLNLAMKSGRSAQARIQGGGGTGESASVFLFLGPKKWGNCGKQRGKVEKERAKWERAEGKRRHRKIERENVCNY